MSVTLLEFNKFKKEINSKFSLLLARLARNESLLPRILKLESQMRLFKQLGITKENFDALKRLISLTAILESYISSYPFMMNFTNYENYHEIYLSSHTGIGSMLKGYAIDQPKYLFIYVEIEGSIISLTNDLRKSFSITLSRRTQFDGYLTVSISQSLKSYLIFDDKRFSIDQLNTTFQSLPMILMIDTQSKEVSIFGVTITEANEIKYTKYVIYTGDNYLLTDISIDVSAYLSNLNQVPDQIKNLVQNLYIDQVRYRIGRLENKIRQSDLLTFIDTANMQAFSDINDLIKNSVQTISYDYKLNSSETIDSLPPLYSQIQFQQGMLGKSRLIYGSEYSICGIHDINNREYPEDYRQVVLLRELSNGSNITLELDSTSILPTDTLTIQGEKYIDIPITVGRTDASSQPVIFPGTLRITQEMVGIEWSDLYSNPNSMKPFVALSSGAYQFKSAIPANNNYNYTYNGNSFLIGFVGDNNMDDKLTLLAAATVNLKARIMILVPTLVKASDASGSVTLSIGSVSRSFDTKFSEYVDIDSGLVTTWIASEEIDILTTTRYCGITIDQEMGQIPNFISLTKEDDKTKELINPTQNPEDQYIYTLNDVRTWDKGRGADVLKIGDMKEKIIGKRLQYIVDKTILNNRTHTGQDIFVNSIDKDEFGWNGMMVQKFNTWSRNGYIAKSDAAVETVTNSIGWYDNRSEHIIMNQDPFLPGSTRQFKPSTDTYYNVKVKFPTLFNYSRDIKGEVKLIELTLKGIKEADSDVTNTGFDTNLDLSHLYDRENLISMTIKKIYEYVQNVDYKTTQLATILDKWIDISMQEFKKFESLNQNANGDFLSQILDGATFFLESMFPTASILVASISIALQGIRLLFKKDIQGAAFDVALAAILFAYYKVGEDKILEFINSTIGKFFNNSVVFTPFTTYSSRLGNSCRMLIPGEGMNHNISDEIEPSNLRSVSPFGSYFQTYNITDLKTELFSKGMVLRDPVKLTRLEFELVRYSIAHKNRDFTKLKFVTKIGLDDKAIHSVTREIVPVIFSSNLYYIDSGTGKLVEITDDNVFKSISSFNGNLSEYKQLSLTACITNSPMTTHRIDQSNYERLSNIILKTNDKNVSTSSFLALPDMLYNSSQKTFFNIMNIALLSANESKLDVF